MDKYDDDLHMMDVDELQKTAVDSNRGLYIHSEYNRHKAIHKKDTRRKKNLALRAHV